MAILTANRISGVVRRIYDTDSLARRLMLLARPYICPFEILYDKVPDGARVLDIGCGDGLFLNILAYFQRISAGTGFDANIGAIENARRAGANTPDPKLLKFVCLSVGDAWPNAEYDVVSMIDVLHHINPSHKQNVISLAAERTAPGGVFMFKDIGMKPRWRALFNSLHDFVLTGERVVYTPLDEVSAWCRRCGLRELERSVHNRFWYGHELAVFIRD